MAEFTREEVIAKVEARESLEGVDLNGLDLKNVPLANTNLTGSDLSYTNLREAEWRAFWRPVCRVSRG